MDNWPKQLTQQNVISFDSRTTNKMYDFCKLWSNIPRCSTYLVDHHNHRALPEAFQTQDLREKASQTH